MAARAGSGANSSATAMSSNTLALPSAYSPAEPRELVLEDDLRLRSAAACCARFDSDRDREHAGLVVKLQERRHEVAQITCLLD
jgi:hypothetical protein